LNGHDLPKSIRFFIEASQSRARDTWIEHDWIRYYIMVEWIKLPSDSSSGFEAHSLLLLFVSNDIPRSLKAWYLLSLSLSFQIDGYLSNNKTMASERFKRWSI
jgi:hypothetical protein